MADEEGAAAIAQAARSERRGSSRGLWVAALLIGAVCAIGFVVLMFSDGSSSKAPEGVVEDHGLGFGAGVVVGIVVGVGVGLAIARQRQSSRNTP